MVAEPSPPVGTLCIGGLPADALLARLQGAGVQLNPMARQLLALPEFQTNEPARTVALVHTSVAGLGLGQGGTWADILAHAARQGWLPCPLGVAPRQRLSVAARIGGPPVDSRPALVNDADPSIHKTAHHD